MPTKLKKSDRDKLLNKVAEKPNGKYKMPKSNFDSFDWDLWLREKDPNYQAEKKVYVDESMKKIKLIKDTLFEGKYSAEYESGAEYFLNSIGEQVKKKGSLTLKQRQSLNKMYNRFKKRVEKNAKKSKKSA